MSPDVISALVNLGSAGAVIAIVIVFLKANKERDAEWRSFFTALNSSSQNDINEMRETAAELTKNLDKLLNLYLAHDTRSMTILSAIEAVKVDVAKLTSSRKSSSVHAGRGTT